MTSKYNMYNVLSLSSSYETPPLRRLLYSFDREIITISQLGTPVRYSGSNDIYTNIVIGGRNCLRLLGLTEVQSQVIHDINILDQLAGQTSRLNNVNTIKCHENTIACGLANGTITLSQIGRGANATLLNRFTDHKRSVNSLDFVVGEPTLLLSGSQDGLIKLWDVRTGSKPVLSTSLGTHSDPIRSCQSSPHTRVHNRITVLSAHDSGTLCKHDLRMLGGFQLPERKWNVHTGPALSLHIHPELEYVLTGGRDHKMCVSNYSSSAAHKLVPEHMINTYGPVMKVRWSPYSNNDTEPSEFEFDPEPLAARALYNYDFACLYLNDGMTLTVHNLARRYVATEVVQSQPNKPFQNFVWGLNSERTRKIFAITKTNSLSAYSLEEDIPDPDVGRPLEDLSAVAFDWNSSVGDFCFVSQDKYEFAEDSDDADSIESSQDERERTDKERSERERMERERTERIGFDGIDRVERTAPVPASLGHVTPGHPRDIPSSYLSLVSGSPIGTGKEKPQMLRSLTHGLFLVGKSPSPVLLQRIGLPLNAMERPKLHRHGSTATQEFAVSSRAHAVNMRGVSVNHASPYVVPLELPLALNDDVVFETLASNYLIHVPDLFTLVDVCLMNASVSASVNRFRDCQVWRVLSVALEEGSERKLFPETEVYESEAAVVDDDDDSKSMMSDLGQFVGSYNSNSTLTTNYEHGVSPERSVGDSKSSVNLTETINQHRGSFSGQRSHGSFSMRRKGRKDDGKEGKERKEEEKEVKEGKDRKEEEKERNGEDKEKCDEKNQKTNEKTDEKVDEKTDEKVDEKVGEKADENAKQNGHHHSTRKSKDVSASVSSRRARLPKGFSMADNENAIVDEDDEAANKVSTLSAFAHRKSSRSRDERPFHIKTPSDPKVQHLVSHLRVRMDDLDDERANVKNSMRSRMSGGIAIPHGVHPSGSTMGSGHPGSSVVQSIGSGFASHSIGSSHAHSIGSSHTHSIAGHSAAGHSVVSGSNGVQSPGVVRGSRAPMSPWQASQSSQTDLLTRPTVSGLSRALKEKEAEESSRPWQVQNILKQTLAFALAQGDIVTCATMSLLFYEMLSEESRQSMLDWLSLYVEILHRKRLFVVAVDVVNMAPPTLKSKLKELVTKEVDLRFYCCWCKKLLLNEKSKGSPNFGYWYCDECSKNQLNCVYCQEPCQGLTVVISLNCGHRGHFGCLREWFILGENVECPGGCDYDVLAR